MFLPRTLTPALPRVLLRRPAFDRLLSFAVIGVICTIAFAGVFWGLRHITGPMQANLGALSSTLLLNFAANRRLTFREHRGPLLQQAAAYGAVYFVGLGASSGVLWVVLALFDHPTGLTEVMLATGASGVATIARYAMLTRWVFRTHAVRQQPAGALNG